MPQNESRLTVFFDDPFWVLVYERVSGGKLEACKITFGAQPKEGEVYAFLLANWAGLRFSPPVAAGGGPTAKPSPKRMQRAIKKQLQAQGVGTKAQLAIKQAQQEGKEARKKKTRLEREREQAQKFALKQEKKKEKHRGH